MNPQNTDIYQFLGWPGVIGLAVVILALTAVAGHILVRLIRKAVSVASDGKWGVGSIIENILRVCTWAAGVAALLYFCLDFNAAVIWGALGIGGVAVSLGAQTTVSNLIGGLQVSFSRDVTIGDWVTIDAVTGQVRDITWRKIVVEDAAGDMHHIPNALMVSTTVTRLTDAGKVTLPFVLAGDCDIELISRELPGIAFDALERAGMGYEGKRPVFSISGTELAGITCSLVCFCSRAYATAQVSSTVMDAVLAYLGERDALPRGVVR